LISLAFLISLPFIVWVIKFKLQFIANIFNVLLGKKTWVGYAETYKNNHLPKIKKGVLSPADAIAVNKMEIETLLMLNEHYAKNYQTINDLRIIYKAFFKLGN
jgi:lipopolysaccharide/colanic/teichoic acid biosynthesis glycosyltransferase